MQNFALSQAEQRVLGCLIEKRFTTPDQYPLSLNSLRLACNQATNRQPVTDYDEGTVREAAQRLCREGLARLASGHSSRATKYRHLAEEALALQRNELALLAVMLLRGAQTPGELKSRSERMASVASLDEVQELLAGLIERGFVRRLERRPGQKEERFEQLLGGERHGTAAQEGAGAPPQAVPAAEPAEAGGGGAGPDRPSALTPGAGTGAAEAPAGAPEAGPRLHAASATGGARAGTPGDGAQVAGAIELRQLREQVHSLSERLSALERSLAQLREQLGEPASGLAP